MYVQKLARVTRAINGRGRGRCQRSAHEGRGSAREAISKKSTSEASIFRVCVCVCVYILYYILSYYIIYILYITIRTHGLHSVL